MQATQAAPRALCTVSVDGALFGIDILRVQEINRHTAVSAVPLAPPSVLGVMSLRGRVVTVLDLGRRLGLSPTALTAETRNVIVQSQDEPIALLVDRIFDVVEVEPADVAPPPANLRGVPAGCLEGVVQAEQGLIGVLDVEGVLRDES